MEASRSGHYRHLRAKLSKKSSLEGRLLIEVKALAASGQNSDGKRRMAKGPQAKGHQVGSYAARSLMIKAGAKCKQRRCYRVITTNSAHRFAVAKNVLGREFRGGAA